IPPYVTHNGTVLNVWIEYPPDHPGRYLQQLIRKRGKRAFIGSSANQHGEPTYVDLLQTLRVFGGTIPAIVDHDLCGVLLQQRQSTTLIDLTGEYPRLMRQGSVPVEELDCHLKRLGLRQLLVEEAAPYI